MGDTTGKRSAGRYLTEVAGGALVIVATAWLSSEAAFRVSAGAGIAAAVGLSIAAVVQGFRLHMASFLLAAILGMAAGVIGALNSGHAREAMAGGCLERASPDDALDRADITRFRFQDARVLTDHRSTVRISSTNPRQPGLSVRHVAPIVDAAWSSGVPVSAWAVASGDASRLEEWDAPLGAAVRASSMAPESDYREAIVRSGLPSRSNAALLVWTDDPDALVDAWRGEVHATLPVFGGFWLVTMLGIVPVARWFAGRKGGHR